MVFSVHFSSSYIYTCLNHCRGIFTFILLSNYDIVSLQHEYVELLELICLFSLAFIYLFNVKDNNFLIKVEEKLNCIFYP